MYLYPMYCMYTERTLSYVAFWYLFNIIELQFIESPPVLALPSPRTQAD